MRDLFVVSTSQGEQFVLTSRRIETKCFHDSFPTHEPTLSIASFEHAQLESARHFVLAED